MSTADDPLGKVVGKALADDAFKERLIADPAAVLATEGVALPEGVTVKVVEDTESVRHLVLPAVGKGALSEADLGRVVAAQGGQAQSYDSCGCDGPGGQLPVEMLH